jgi:hypothetical protein
MDEWAWVHQIDHAPFYLEDMRFSAAPTSWLPPTDSSVISLEYLSDFDTFLTKERAWEKGKTWLG